MMDQYGDIVHLHGASATSGQELMERALQIRNARGVEAAATWMEERGIPFRLALMALRGFRRWTHDAMPNACAPGVNRASDRAVKE